MAKYRKIDVRIWNGQYFMSLPDQGKLAFLFLMTHPHLTMLGAMRGSVPGLAAELGWLPEDFKKGLEIALNKGMVRTDESNSFIWLPNFLKFNKPESPNVVKSWAHALDYLPECDLKNELIQHVVICIKDLPQAFIDALPDIFKKNKINQEQKQEQEQKKEIRRVANASQPVSSDKKIVGVQDNDSVIKIFDYWKSVMNHPKARLDEKRRRKIKSALQQYSFSEIQQAIKGCSMSLYHQGNNENKMVYDSLELILRDAEHVERFIQLTVSSNPVDILSNNHASSSAVNNVFVGAI